MDTFLKAVVAVFGAVIICVVLAKQGKEFAIILTVLVSCLILAAAFTFLKPVIDLVERLSELGNLNDQMLEILLKAVGVALLAETTELVCKDAGNNTLGKALQILSMAVIVWLAIPLFNELIDLIQTVLEYA